jgi:hypothetical protein
MRRRVFSKSRSRRRAFSDLIRMCGWRRYPSSPHSGQRSRMGRRTPVFPVEALATLGLRPRLPREPRAEGGKRPSWELTSQPPRYRVIAMFRRLLLLAMGLGIIGSPVAALYCSERDAATMACCKRDMSNCNRPGKTEDCCHPSAASGGFVAAKVDQSARLAPPSLSLVPQLDHPERPAARAAVGPRPWEPAQDLSPPTLSVIRV